MARIRLLSIREAGWFARFFNYLSRRRMGKASSAAQLLGHHKRVFFSWAIFMAGVDRWNELPTRLKRLVHLRVAMRVGCPA
ncbi:MAG: hypothetical protein GY937_20425 [bacterium]|nr:hypothetical protein [bacterium]